METSDVLPGGHEVGTQRHYGTQGAEEPMDTSNPLLGAPGVEEQWAPNIYLGLRDPWTLQIFSQEHRGGAPRDTRHRYGDPRA